MASAMTPEPTVAIVAFARGDIGRSIATPLSPSGRGLAHQRDTGLGVRSPDITNGGDMSVRTIRILGALVLAAAIAGCASPAASVAPTASLAASPSSAPTASASVDVGTAAPSSPAASAASGDGELCAEEFEPCPIQAGTYTTSAFEHPFTFTIDGDGWTNDRNWPHGGSMTKAGVEAFLWASGVVSGNVDGETVDIGPAPADFIAHLGKFDGFTVSEPVPVTLDGVSGLQVDVLSNDVQAPGMFLLPEDAFNLAPNEKARFLVLDKGGSTVILIVDAFDAATFDAFMADVGQPLLDGLTWE